ncbi:hypothetical protein BC939DRAFT_1683 [Gamsiella multidivaricata]|uniref:uncharacterized protein n=1 Tax=Gamsiella multidivaricata TaxID=101098 RepID=UPI0022205152|nr:uncharacterized protein BC939DRAFT_1683 [Gamsiella multidivaricata]KAG0358075.1 hypothetical protein BGZ54_010606 [Gamsiella multidivaricata]KAI7832593.1 hypothetical protein BC939DRAFT_1683 [Gamsiella multidivaricata]
MLLPLNSEHKRLSSTTTVSPPICDQGKHPMGPPHSPLHGQTLLHPVVSLHTPHQQQQQRQPRSQKRQENHQQQQQRPDSPTSFEDSFSESGADTVSVDSTDSADSADSTENGVNTAHAFEHGHDYISAGNSADVLSSSLVRNPVSILTLQDCNSNNMRNYLAPSLMIATPPLSPTRQQFVKEPVEVQVPGTEKVRPEEWSKTPPARARAGSAPPPATRAARSSRVAPAVTPVILMAPRISSLASHLPAQPASAWTALLPGVAPIRVNPRPIVRPPMRSSTPNISTEQRLHQQVPIVLPPEREASLTMEMYRLFENLLPTEESHQRRTMLISKIEGIIHTEWPGQDIKVLPFGSTVNDLGTNTSDVDICILTSWLGLQGVEMLAEVFRKHGMENVFCVPGAKVPIVKLWDPQLQLSCDMNINTQLGIMNSRMVRTYVAIDPRVRPFAMIIKHWARKRVLNDAANGGTISTYTWICMVINFLQMRSPPILPSLHDMPHELSPDNQIINGNNTSFFSDLSQLEGFGDANKESLGGLLYAFFRKFAIEFDYDHHVVSVRHGCYLTKESKGWHIPGKHYRLFCIEEPFDTTRNLGNSCDMASSKGLKQEFRRALDILNHNSSLDQVCEQWVFPPCYYHNNNNSVYNRSGGVGNFSANNHSTLGRRYVNGYRSHHHSFHGRNEGSADADDTVRHTESWRPRGNNSSYASNNRYDRAGHEKRARSNSVSPPSKDLPSLTSTRISNTRKDATTCSEVGVTSSTLEEAAAINFPRNDSGKALAEGNAVGVEGPAQNRPRKSSIRTRDDTAGSSMTVGKQGERNGTSRPPSSPPASPPRHKSTGKSHGGEGPKGHGGQKNGRANGNNRDGGHGGKVPRAAVELCLADIARIVNKPESTQTGPIGTAGDSTECRKKKGGKKSVLWSTNSNRGELRGNHQGLKQQDSAEQAKARSIVVPAELGEAGPGIDAM